MESQEESDAQVFLLSVPKGFEVEKLNSISMDHQKGEEFDILK